MPKRRFACVSGTAFAALSGIVSVAASFASSGMPSRGAAMSLAERNACCAAFWLPAFFVSVYGQKLATCGSAVSSHMYCSTISQFVLEFCPQPCWFVHSIGRYEPS